MDAAIYSRLSKNRGGLSDNCDIQEAESYAYAEDKGWNVVMVERDDDTSASKFSTKPRPGYERLIAAVESGQIEIIICTETSRLYRRIEELLELIRLAGPTRLKGIWTTDDVGYDLSTPEGVHQAVGAVNNSVLESAKLSKRLKRKKAARARQGVPSGGHRSFGYSANGLELVPEEVSILHEARDRYLAGATMKEIVRDFNARGVVTSEGKPLTIENFQRTLFNKRHIGIRVHNGAEYPAVWPAIFTAQEYEQMDARRRARASQWPGRGRAVGRQYLLTGLVYCGRCGAYMVGKRRKIGNGYQRRYVCRAVDNYGARVGCGKVFRGADPVDLWITEAVLYRFDTPEIASALAEPEEADKTDDLVAAYQVAKDNLDQMVADYASGFLSRDEFAIAKRVTEAAVDSTREALSRNQANQVMQLPEPGLMRQTWATASLEWRHEVVALLVERIVIHPGSPGSHLWRGWRFDPQSVSVVWRA